MRVEFMDAPSGEVLAVADMSAVPRLGDGVVIAEARWVVTGRTWRPGEECCIVSVGAAA